MTCKKKISWKHIVSHLVAIWALQKMGMHVTLLSDPAYLALLKEVSTGETDHGALLQKHYAMLLNIVYFGGGGIILGVIVSMGLSIHRKWFWVNSLLSLVLLIGWSILSAYAKIYPMQTLFNPVNGLFDSMVLQQVFFAGVFMSISVIMFFLPALNRWIAKDYQQDFEEPEFQFEEQSTVKT